MQQIEEAKPRLFWRAREEARLGVALMVVATKTHLAV